MPGLNYRPVFRKHLSGGLAFSVMVVVRIRKAVLQAIVKHALDEAPLECCGLLVGDSEVVTHHRPMRNVLQSPVRYAMDPLGLFQFFKELRNGRQKHLGIYHSHPTSAARPSRIDIEESFYPDCAYFIISLKAAHLPQVCAFRIDNSCVEQLQVVEVE